MKTKNLQLQQLDAKMKAIDLMRNTVPPPSGWIRAIRQAIGMSLEQLGRKTGGSKQTILAMENREKLGSVTINTLREAAAAMDMELVYGFVPKDGSLDALLQRRAKEMAATIVGMASQTMQLEGQGISDERLQRAIKERAKEILDQTPKILWD